METGFIDLDQLQFFMSVLQYNIPEILQVGKVQQEGSRIHHVTYSGLDDAAWRVDCTNMHVAR